MAGWIGIAMGMGLGIGMGIGMGIGDRTRDDGSMGDGPRLDWNAEGEGCEDCGL